MLNYMRENSEKGQIAIMLAVAMIGLVGIVGLAIDGGMLFWNQRRAQNGADAAAMAGVSALVDLVLNDSFVCGTTSDQPVLDKVAQYTLNNEVPTTAAANDADGKNVVAYYLVTDGDGDWVDLVDSGGNSVQVGSSGTVPCADVVGIRVEAEFPQSTFLAGVIGIAESNVRVDASAVYDQNNWCTGFLLFASSTDRRKQTLSLTGAYTRLEGGGAHSNGGMQLGGGGQSIYLEPGAPIEYGEGGDTGFNCGKVVGGPDDIDGTCSGFEGVNPIPKPEYYDFEDFQPYDGFLYKEAVGGRVTYMTSDINENHVKDGNGNLIPGLYITTGNINLNNVDVDADEMPWQATLVAKGTIKISGSLRQVPYFRGIFAVSYSNDTNNGAIQLSGSDNSWAGTVVAPNGLVNLSGARNSELGGQILGYEIDISGANNSLVYHSSYCPVNYPKVKLVE